MGRKRFTWGKNASQCFTLRKWLPIGLYFSKISSGAVPWWLSEQVAILCLVFKRLIHPTNWLVSNLQKGEQKMTCWCGVLEDEVPVRIIASKLEELCEKQTWKGTKYFSTDVFHLNFGFKEQHQFWSQKRQLQKIYLYSLITHSLHKLGGVNSEHATAGSPGSGWLRGMAMLLPKSLTPPLATVSSRWWNATDRWKREIWVGFECQSWRRATKL